MFRPPFLSRVSRISPACRVLQDAERVQTKIEFPLVVIPQLYVGHPPYCPEWYGGLIVHWQAVPLEA